MNRPSALLDYLARPLPDLQLVSSLGLLRFPTLFWIDASDAVLPGAGHTGCRVALLLTPGRRPLY